MSNKEFVFLSPAKINLYLNVTGKYPNGYHAIESVVVRVGLFDTIEIKKNSSPKVIFSCNEKGLENEENLCLRACYLLKEKFPSKFKQGLQIHLRKEIPVGAGLGGGSSNAATTILALNKLYDLKLNLKQMYNIGEQLGSDVNFFISQSSAAIMRGRGEIICPFQITKKINFLIIYPKIQVSTYKVYKSLNSKLTKFLNNANILKFFLQRGDVETLRRFCYNTLEKAAMSIFPTLKEVKRKVCKLIQPVFLSGSGSCFFIILANEFKKSQFKKKTIEKIQDLGYSCWQAVTY